jgi:hypothetical protein
MNLLYQTPNQSTPERELPHGQRPLPVVGYRTWKLCQTAGGVALKSLFNSGHWPVGVTRARCQQCAPWMVVNHHPVPNLSCECGLYAFSAPVAAARHIERRLGTVSGACDQPVSVWGAVVGWGRLVQHGSQGWRAEYARPVALLDTGHALLEAAAARYGVPLLSWKGVQLVAQEHGEPLTGT